MKPIFRQNQLLTFLLYCNDIKLEKKVLDCGAGGNLPPLAIFEEHGYQTIGIEISKDQIERARRFEKEHNLDLGIREGDMKSLPFEDESISFVYSYNSIFHMKKVDIEKALMEMKRVLKPNGLMFVNFLSIDDFRCGEGPCLGDHEYEQMDDEPVIHSYFRHTEADRYFEDMNLLYKEVRVLERIYEGKLIKQGFIDYILRK